MSARIILWEGTVSSARATSSMYVDNGFLLGSLFAATDFAGSILAGTGLAASDLTTAGVGAAAGEETGLQWVELKSEWAEPESEWTESGREGAWPLCSRCSSLTEGGGVRYTEESSLSIGSTPHDPHCSWWS